jgi:uncharacterized protein
MKKLLLLLLLLPALVFGQGDFEETKALADSGDASAQYLLGLKYYEGEGVPQHYEEAVKWWRLASAQGNANAQYYLAGMYVNGTGVDKNYVRAYAWLSVVVAQGPQTIVAGRNSAGRGFAGAKNDRDGIGEEALTPEELTTGQALALKCFESDFKDCPF